MKKLLKVSLIFLASLLGLIIATISIVVWLVFTPEKLTPILRNQADKFISCQSDIGRVELTFFSTFPQFGLKVNHLTLINSLTGAPSDTLLSVEQFVGIVDIMALWNSNELRLSDLSLIKGTINAYIDAEGNNNFNVLLTDTVADPEPESEIALDFINLGDVGLENINLSYIDHDANINAEVNNLYAKMSGSLHQDSLIGEVDVSRSDIVIKYNDQKLLHTTSNPDSIQQQNNTSVIIHNLSAKLSGSFIKDSISGALIINQSDVSFQYNGEKYLQNAAVQLNLPANINLSQQQIWLNKATLNINDLGIVINGSIENDTIQNIILTDIDYDFKTWPVKTVIALIPPSYQSYLQGIEVDGLITSTGKIKGIYGESSMPLMDIKLLMENGKLKYQSFPIPLNNINSDLNIYTDLKNNDISYVKINNFSARTPKSTIKTSGTVNNLFSDIYINLTTDAALTLDEFKPIIPSDMKISMKGSAQGRVKSAFSLSQIQKMQLEKLKLNGNLLLTNLDVVYDSLWVKTDQSKLEFSLPNHFKSSGNTKFLFTKIFSNNLEAGKTDSYQAFLKNANISVETSDVRDTTRIPDLICSFAMDSLTATMDTISLAIQKPYGKVSLAPGKGIDQPKIELNYNSNVMNIAMGHSIADLEKVNIDTKIVNDNTQSDVFLKWLVKGFINMDKGYIASPDLKYPIYIPAIKMDFDPEVFDIKESRVIISNSDFELSGKLQNILSYFRGDSLLRGDFKFASNSTDVYQLMNLTNGIGSNPEPEDKPSEDGPYMVPKGVDLFLSTYIKQASYLTTTASDIKGNVRVKDGILVLDELKFSTPAARAQLTAMYKTPRKNHIYLGLDYHLLDVEISELLEMIPEVDSLMPMLRSFGGNGEFHMAIETYMDSTYNIKTSTLLGAASISGQDLVLMDGETFSMIAKKLMFKKKTENRVKNLFAEFTIFKDQIDVYPLLIEIDKYGAVVGGRHNTNLTYDYIITVVESPLPFRLRLSIKGDEDDFRTKLGLPKYAKNYKPVVKGVVSNKQMELRKIIRDALIQKVR